MKNFLKGLVALLLIAGVAQAWNLRQRNEGTSSWERTIPPGQTLQEIDVGEHYLTVQISDFTRFMTAAVIIPLTYAEIVRVQGLMHPDIDFAGGDAYFTFWVSQASVGVSDLTEITSGTTGIRFRPAANGRTVQTFTASATQQLVMRGAVFSIQSDGGPTDSTAGQNQDKAVFTITVRPRRQ